METVTVNSASEAYNIGYEDGFKTAKSGNVDITLERRSKRVCECGGELEFVGVGYDFKPRTRCMKCGKEHTGVTGTKVVS